MSRSSVPLLALGLLLGLPGRASAARVLFVSDAGGDLAIEGVLRADGHEVATVSGDFASGNSTLRGDLSSYDLVVWSATGGGYGDEHTDGSVFDNLRAFVERGGRVLVTGYDTVASPFDPRLCDFLGASGSTDVPPPPGPILAVETSLTAGLFDLRDGTPQPTSSDRDTLTGLYGDTIEIVGTSGGGGSQWTLRRLGAGEIAYVSNGDAGAASSASWTASPDAYGGAYNAALRNFAAAAHRESAVTAAPTLGSPRRARAMYLLSAPQPAVLVASDRAWIPSGEIPLAICAGPACHPIRETRACTVPECPGTGTLLVSSERVADVDDFPRDRVGWNRERALLLADAELSALGWAFGYHPEPEPPPPSPPRPPRFRHDDHDWLGWELRLEGGVGVLAHAGLAVGTTSASLGVHFQPDMEEGLDVLYGTILGADLRVTVVPGITGQRPEDLAVFVGLSPTFSYAFPNERVRIPPAWAWVVPEFGLAVSTVRPLTYYVAWHLESAILLDEHVGASVRADFLLLDEWVDGDDVEGLFSLSAGFFFR